MQRTRTIAEVKASNAETLAQFDKAIEDRKAIVEQYQAMNAQSKAKTAQ